MKLLLFSYSYSQNINNIIFAENQKRSAAIKKWSKKSAPRVNHIFTFISFYLILFFLPFLLFSHQLLPQLHFFLFFHSISSSLKKLKTLALTKLHCISTIKAQSKGRKSVSLSPNSIKRNATWEPVKSTHSADRTTGELRTSMACIILQKYFWYFPTDQISVSCRRSNGAVWHICDKLILKYIQICG